LERVSDDFSKPNCPIYRVHFKSNQNKKEKPLKFQRFDWWSIGGSNSQANSEHIEKKGGEHAIFFHPTKNPTRECLVSTQFHP
jgi:hypothetical protein